jgi:hypothetical protein
LVCGFWFGVFGLGVLVWGLTLKPTPNSEPRTPSIERAKRNQTRR